MLDLAEIKRRRALTPPNWGTGIFMIPVRVADIDALIEEVERLRVAANTILECGHSQDEIAYCQQCEEFVEEAEFLHSKGYAADGTLLDSTGESND